jgi:hypothetical protein
VSGLADLQAADFTACVGDEIGVRVGDDVVRMTVRSVDVQGAGWDRPEAFSVLFTGPMEAQLSQGLYGLEHPLLPDVEVLLVPIARVEGGIRYEAIFN